MINVNNVCQFEGNLTKDPTIKEFPSKNKNDEEDSRMITLSIRVDRGMSKAQREKAKENGWPIADYVTCTGFNGVTKFFEKAKEGDAVKVICSWQNYNTGEKDDDDKPIFRSGFRIEASGYPSHKFEDNGNNHSSSEGKSSKKSKKEDDEPKVTEDKNYVPF